MTTKSDEARQLSPQQQAAIPLLLQGNGITAVAQDMGMARQTISAWLNSDTLFIAALNAERSETWDGQKERLRSLIPKAIDVLERGLDSTDEKVSQAAARDILKIADINSLTPSRSVTEADVKVDLQSKVAFRNQRSFSAALGNIHFK